MALTIRVLGIVLALIGVCCALPAAAETITLDAAHTGRLPDSAIVAVDGRPAHGMPELDPLHPHTVTYRFFLKTVTDMTTYALAIRRQGLVMDVAVPRYDAGRHKRGYEHLRDGLSVRDGNATQYASLFIFTLPREAFGHEPILVNAKLTFPLAPRIGPIQVLAHDEYRRDMIMLAFVGFFIAMAIINAMSFAIVRDPASAWYGGLMIFFALLMVFSVWPWPSAILAYPWGNGLTHAVFLGGYFCCVAGFASTFLHARQTAPLFNALIWATFALNLPPLFIQDLNEGHLLDVLPFNPGNFALGIFLLTLVVAGVVVDRRNPGAGAKLYILSFIGPGVALGMWVFDLTRFFAPATWSEFLLEGGIAWEATFFGFAMSLRARRVQRENLRLEHLVAVDGLTGIYNRRHFDDVLERETALTARSHEPLAILMIDVDEFKRYNDTNGHLAGDDCLRAVAAACSSVLQRPRDMLARYGGEEFAAILPATPFSAARALAERMLEAVRELAIPHTASAEGIVTISIGVAAGVPELGEPTPLVLRADSALYQAKVLGRNRIVAAAT